MADWKDTSDGAFNQCVRRFYEIRDGDFVALGETRRTVDDHALVRNDKDGSRHHCRGCLARVWILRLEPDARLRGADQHDFRRTAGFQQSPLAIIVHRCAGRSGPVHLFAQSEGPR